MTVQTEDLFGGAIAWFDPAVLNTHDQCLKPEWPVQPKPYLRPFLCYWRRPGVSAWLPLTSQYQPQRFPLLRGWIRNAFGIMQRKQSFIADFRTCYRGEDPAFLAAAIREQEITGPRPRLTEKALRRIQDEVRAAGGFIL